MQKTTSPATSYTFFCEDCQETKTHINPCGYGGTGYVVTMDGKTLCYACTGKRDYKELLDAKPGQRFTLYLTGNRVDGYKVQNWCGTFSRSVSMVSKSVGRFFPNGSRSSVRVERTDVWFEIQGNHFWGFNKGDNQILHIKCLKK